MDRTESFQEAAENILVAGFRRERNSQGQQRPNDCQKAQAVDQEAHGRTEKLEDRAADRLADGPREVELDRDQRDCVGKDRSKITAQLQVRVDSKRILCLHPDLR